MEFALLGSGRKETSPTISGECINPDYDVMTVVCAHTGFTSSSLTEHYPGLQLGPHPHQNYDNVLSPIGMAPDAPVSRSRSVNHLAPAYKPQDAVKRKSMQHFGSNLSLSGGAFPQRKIRALVSIFSAHSLCHSIGILLIVPKICH